MMKKFLKTLLVGIMLLSTVLMPLAACDDSDQTVITVPSAKGFKLDYYSGIQDDGQYDSSKYYRNELRTSGADPGAIFCSEEDITDTYNKVRATKAAQAGYAGMTAEEKAAWDTAFEAGSPEDNMGTLEDWIAQYVNNFYVIVTGNLGGGNLSQETKNKYGSADAAYILRESTDLVDWSVAGRVDGYAINIRSDAWTNGSYWAPEFIRDPKSGRYFIFASAQCKNGNDTTEYIPHEGTYYNMLYGLVAMSDNPVGPYELITSEDYYRTICAYNDDGSLKINENYELLDPEGEVLTTVDPETGNIEDKNGHVTTKNTPVFNYGLFVDSIRENPAYAMKTVEHESAMWPAIDYNPVIIDGELYVYFSQHISDLSTGNHVWGIKMKDFITPDFSTLTHLASPGYKTVTRIDPSPEKDGDINNFQLGEKTEDINSNWTEGSINEGTEVIAHVDSKSGKTKYYLTFSPYGYGSRAYAIRQAVGDSPLGPFEKLDMNYNPVVGINADNDYMAGTGHHCFIQAGEELFVLYHAFYNPENNSPNGTFLGRAVGADRVQFMYNSTLGYDILYGNGPTYSLQPLPDVATGQTNVAKLANVTVDGNTATKGYLTDGLFTVQPFVSEWEYMSKNENRGTTITLTWDQPVEISSFIVYNAQKFFYAFNKLDLVRFKLAEKPAFYPADAAYNGYCYMTDVLCDPANVNEEKRTMRQGGGALAAFEPIKVTEMTVRISSKYTTRTEDLTGKENYQINVSELYVMGKEA